MRKSILLAFLLMVAAQARAATEVRVYPLGLQDVRTAEALVEPLLSRDGRVHADEANHRLIVSDHASVHVRIKAALSMTEVSGRNLRIEVESRRSGTSRDVGGSVGVERGRRGPRVTLGGGASQSRSGGTALQQILVLDGGRAEIRVAEEIPEPEWFWTWGVGHGAWQEGVRWRDVTTSLVVQPMTLPDGRIRVRLTPRFDYRIDATRRSTEIVELSTDVVVGEGEWLDIGGLPFRDESFRERFLIGFDDQRRTTRIEIRLRARRDDRPTGVGP